MMKGQKGITLVALIITIIVMLILVGVSISVAVNGGLFTKAGTAKEETNKAKMSEAVALAKAEILTNFHAAKTNAERFKPAAEDNDASTDDVTSLIQSYLGDTQIKFKVASTEDGYTVTVTDPDYIPAIEIDLTGVNFAKEGTTGTEEPGTGE